MDIENYLKSMEGNDENAEEKTFKLENYGFKAEGQQKLENITLAGRARVLTSATEKFPVSVLT